MTRVLFATRAWESPPLEGGLLLLKDLAQHLVGGETVEPWFFSTVGGDDSGVKLLRVFGREGWGRLQGLQFFIALLRHAGKFDVIHFAHVPTRSNARLIRFLKYLHPHVHFVQTITAVNRAHFSAHTMIWGDAVVTVGPALQRYLREEHDVETEIIPPVPRPGRLGAGLPVPRELQDRISGCPVIVFPIDVDRLDLNEFGIAELHARLQQSRPDIVFILLDRFGASEGKVLNFSDITPGAIILLPAIDYMMALLHCADVVAYPISNVDGKFNPPMVLLEALGIGRPVVCSDVVDVHESDSLSAVAGFKVSAWAQAIADFLDRAPRLEAVADAGFSDVCAEYAALYCQGSGNEMARPDAITSMADMEDILQALAEQQQFTIFVRKGRSRQFDSTGVQDVDLWLGSVDAAKLDGLLRSLGAMLLINRRGKAWASQRVYLLPVADGVVQLDVGLDSIAAGPLRYGPLSDFDGQPGLFELPGDVEVFAHGAKRLMRGKGLPDTVVAELRSLYGSLDEGSRSRLAKFLRQPAERVDKLFAQDSSAHKIRRVFRRRIRRAFFATLRHPLEFVRVLRAKLSLPGWPRPFGRRVRGQVIAIVGTDGSGKSTTQERLQAALDKDGYRTKYMYMGRARGNLLVTDSIKSSAGKASETSRHSRLALKYLASWFYVFDYSVRLARVWYLSRIRGYSVLCDRYFYDIETMESYSRVGYAILKLIALKPDVLVGLDCSVDVLMQRKAERSREVYAQQRDFYQRLAASARVRYRRESFRTDKLDSDQIISRIGALVNRSAHRRYDY